MARYSVAPLPASFTLIGLLGFVITAVYTGFGKLPLPYGFAFSLIFVLMFIASVISITPRSKEL